MHLVSATIKECHTQNSIEDPNSSNIAVETSTQRFLRIVCGLLSAGRSLFGRPVRSILHTKAYNGALLKVTL